MEGVTDEPLALMASVSLPGQAYQALSRSFVVDWSQTTAPTPRQPEVGRDARRLAAAFFERSPDASRETAMPFGTAILIGKLQAASRDPDAWSVWKALMPLRTMRSPRGV